MKTTRILADAKVSYYNHVWENPSKVVSLLDILTTDEFKDIVEAIRAELDEKRQKELKRETLPLFCAVGIASSSRPSSLLEGCGYVVADVDAKDNLSICNFSENLPAYITDKKLCPDIAPNIAYCGRSCRGKGFQLAIPINDPNRWKDHYRAIVEVLRKYGITADENASSNFRRYVSYDRTPYINHDAEVFTLTRSKPIKILPKQQRKRKASAFEVDITRRHVEAIIEKIEASGKDITEDPREWWSLAASLAGEFGEAGRTYYHRISRFHSEYNERKTDYNYNYAVKKTTITINRFFDICKRHGFKYAD